MQLSWTCKICLYFGIESPVLLLTWTQISVSYNMTTVYGILDALDSFNCERDFLIDILVHNIWVFVCSTHTHSFGSVECVVCGHLVVGAELILPLLVCFVPILGWHISNYSLAWIKVMAIWSNRKTNQLNYNWKFVGNFVEDKRVHCSIWESIRWWHFKSHRTNYNRLIWSPLRRFFFYSARWICF